MEVVRNLDKDYSVSFELRDSAGNLVSNLTTADLVLKYGLPNENASVVNFDTFTLSNVGATEPDKEYSLSAGTGKANGIYNIVIREDKIILNNSIIMTSDESTFYPRLLRIEPLTAGTFEPIEFTIKQSTAISTDTMIDGVTTEGILTSLLSFFAGKMEYDKTSGDFSFYMQDGSSLAFKMNLNSGANTDLRTNISDGTTNLGAILLEG